MKIKLNGLQKLYLAIALLIFMLTSPFMFATYGNDIYEKTAPHQYVVTGTVGIEYFIPCILLHVVFTIIVLVLCADGSLDGKIVRRKNE